MSLRYFTIPENYSFDQGGWHWSDDGTEIETGDCQTFAFAPQIWQFLEGLVAARSPPCFAHVLHLMRMLGCGPIHPAEGPIAELRRAFLLAGRPLRNAGVLCAELCAELPVTSLPVEPVGLRQALLHRAADVYGPAEIPPLTAHAFERRIAARLEHFTPSELLNCLKSGQLPNAATGERLAEELLARPPNLLAALARAARERERLAGALALVPALSGMLTLPPRRLNEPELPIGGYADITTRGEPERLLPAQFALEQDEFVRRFAEHELLFFRREEPGLPTREELVLLLDQGVRTWGAVRLALAGAVFAFAALAQRRRIPFRLAATSTGGSAIDPLGLEVEELGSLLEASDLSASPSDALSELLGDESALLRDIVLLTHPRSLDGERFVAAAATLPAEHRLFAVSVDGEGRGRLDHLLGGRPIAVSRFRVDLQSALRPPTPRFAIEDAHAWTGDVEPIPFPFWFGPVRSIKHLAFGAEGQWLLIATSDGLLHAQHVTEHRREVLPRGFVAGRPLTDVDAVLGMPSGFVVCGHITPADAPAPRLTAVHYDLGRRRARLHFLPVETRETPDWFSFPDLHAIACRTRSEIIWGIDLDTLARFPDPASPLDVTARARAAANRARRLAVPPPHVAAAADALDDDAWYLFERSKGWFQLCGLEPESLAAIPLRDGRPALKDARITGVQRGGDLFVLRALNGQSLESLLVLRAGDGTVVREMELRTPGVQVRLADDGRRLAVQSANFETRVIDFGAGGAVETTILPGRVHTNLDVDVTGEGEALHVAIGQFGHRFEWGSGELQHTCGKARALVRRGPTPPELPRLAHYDPRRFLARPVRRLHVATDRYGHVLVFDRAGERLTAMFGFRRERAAVWLPDGTRWGSEDIGGTPSPGAAQRVAEALRQAASH